MALLLLLLRFVCGGGGVFRCVLVVAAAAVILVVVRIIVMLVMTTAASGPIDGPVKGGQFGIFLQFHVHGIDRVGSPTIRGIGHRVRGRQFVG